NTARSMVTKYGFSDKIGTVVYGSDNDEVFLGKDYGHTRNYSEAVAAQIDEEVRLIIEKAYKDCKVILTENMDKLHLLAKYLLKFEKIEGADFEKLMRGEITESVLEDAPVREIPSEENEATSSDEE
ncbi:MAG: ATP-dependent zinc metalloprotease FtsH, partial [Ruminococcus sp.]